MKIFISALTCFSIAYCGLPELKIIKNLHDQEEKSDKANTQTDDEVYDIYSEKMQECQNHLQKLDPSNMNNQSIDNTCVNYVLNNEQAYESILSYNLPYFHDPDCTTQALFFEGIQLQEGEDYFNQWKFDSKKQEIKFSIRHQDLTSKYGCEQVEDDSQFSWICEETLVIYYQGYEQLRYQFQLCIFLDRIHTDLLVITVRPNLVIGDCCENRLNVHTDLQFCSDFSCDEYILDQHYVVERASDVYCEHFIDPELSPQFRFYFLQGISLKLGNFIPEIVKSDGSQAGRCIYHFRANIAMPMMELEAISRLADTQSRRNLENIRSDQIATEDIGDDYKLKGVQTLTIMTESEYQRLQEDSQEDKKSSETQENTINTPEIVLGSILGLFMLITCIGGIVYCCKKGKKGTQYEQKIKSHSRSSSVDSKF